jgi:hypothetical protein
LRIWQVNFSNKISIISLINYLKSGVTISDSKKWKQEWSDCGWISF